MPAEQHQHSQCIAVKRYEQRGRDPIVKQALHDAVYHCDLLTTVIYLPLWSTYRCDLLTTALCLPLQSASRYMPSHIHWRGYVITRIVSMWLLRVVSGNIGELHHLTVSAYFSILQFGQQQCRALDHLQWEATGVGLCRVVTQLSWKTQSLASSSQSRMTQRCPQYQ